MNGQVQLASLAPAPETLYKLLTMEDPNTNMPFVNQIRAYNQVFAFTSIRTKLDKNLVNA